MLHGEPEGEVIENVLSAERANVSEASCDTDTVRHPKNDVDTGAERSEASEPCTKHIR